LETFSILLIWQALLFSVLFAGIYLKTRHYPKLFIALFMLANAVFFRIIRADYFEDIRVLQYMYPLAMPLLVSFMPLFYYYFRALISINFKVRRSQLGHMVPSLLLLILQIPFFFLPGDDASLFLAHQPVTGRYESLYYYLLWINRISFFGFFTLQIIYYVFKFIKNLKMYRLRLELMFSYKENLDLRWMRYLLFATILFFSGLDLIFFLKDMYPAYSLTYYSIGMLAINFYIGYQSLIQNELPEHEIIARMSHYCALHRRMTEPKSDNRESESEQELQKYQKSALKDDTREQIIQQLDVIMAEEELYTDSQINIEDLAMKLSINSRHLSQAINEVHQKNFFNYINELRISKAKIMLREEAHSRLSIEGIARVVGFQSKSSFYTAFKKSTGSTPTEYRDETQMASTDLIGKTD
jgi:AraC-like DNA-binding protein